MEIEVVQGLLKGIRQIPSANCDDRPEDTVVDLIVIHGISLPPGNFGGPWIDALFTNTLDPTIDPYFREIQGLKVSAHLLIRRDGQMVQYVPFHRRAWHAGHSSFKGRMGCNDFSIGIELEGTDTVPYTDIQYHCLAGVIRALLKAYPAIAPERIVGHADIAPGRKTDPGAAFQWTLLGRLLEQESSDKKINEYKNKSQ